MHPSVIDDGCSAPATLARAAAHSVRCVFRGIRSIASLLLAAAAFLFLGTKAGAQIVPYLQTPTPTTMWVSWQTSSGTESTVKFGASSSALTSTATGTTQNLGSNYNWHNVQLTGLTPNTYYYYQVQTNGSTSNVLRFRTLPAAGSRTGTLRVLVAGDNQIQTPARWKSLMTAAKSKIEGMYNGPIESAVNLLVTDGDQVDGGTIAEYQNTHFGMANVVAPNIPVFTTIGNHEGYTDTSYSLYNAHFRYETVNYGAPSPAGKEHLYYAYQVATIVFIHMDTESAETNSTQQNWVQSVINAANSDPNVDFIVLVHHRPYNVELYVGDTSPWVHDTIMPIAAASPKTVLDFAGHHHLYARGQTKNWPIYHMIAGGSAWDEYWGQSTQQDMDDVQKTICNWTWQLVEFDLAAKKMTVSSYSEGGPLIGPNGTAVSSSYDNSNNTMGTYTSKLVDTFHRQMGLVAPNTPALTDAGGTITLPATFHSSAFSTSAAGETLNTTEFQISTSSAFTSVARDSVRDFENLYLDSGSPLYLPVDQNSSVNILNYTVPGNALANGAYYIRVRHRDSNVSWSNWSNPLSFTVTGSTGGTTSLALDKSVYPVNAAINATYQYGPGLSKDWIGIYKKGQTPNSVTAATWAYVNTTGGNTLASGTLKFTKSLVSGSEYFAGYFTNDGYQELAPRVPFYVGPTPTLTSSQSVYPAGATASISFSNAPGNSKDWIGIYKVGDVPQTNPSTAWAYVTAKAGTMNFAGLANGYYVANYYVNDGYTSIATPLRFTVGSNITQCTISGTSFTTSQSFTISYTNGPGVLKDYVGIFFAEATPGGNGPRDRLQYYVYPDPLGSANATVTVPAGALPADNYKAAVFTNDSYTSVSNFVTFSVH